MAPPRPKWLPSEGPGNLNVSPEEWGMTLRQWAAFIMACMLSCKETWQELSDNTDRKESGYINLYQICDTYVKPWTRNLGNSISLLMNGKKPLKAEVMISHAWGEDIIESMMGVLGKASISGMSLDTVVWFCTFAQYQPGDMEGDCGPGVAAQLALDPFKKVIASRPRFGMLVIHTSVAELYGRLWCVYEVNASENADLLTHAATSLKYFVKTDKEFQDLSETGLSEDEARRQVAGCNAAEARCWSADDEKMIKGQIETGIGYDALNEKIFQFRSQSMMQMFKAAQPLVEWAQPIMDKMGIDRFIFLTECFVPTIRGAGYFVGLHCLMKFVEGQEDEEYIAAMMALAREVSIGQMKCDDDEGEDMGLPPGFHPSKRKPDSFLAELMEDDDLLKSCMRDLTDFQHPLGWLELGAGANFTAALADDIHVDKTDADSMEAVREVFKQFDSDGSGTISREELKQVFLSIPGSPMTENSVEVMFAAADANNDGVIDYNEFVNWLSGSSMSLAA